MWTDKAVPTPCPQCTGRVRLSLTLAAGDQPLPALAGNSIKVVVSVRPKLYCVGMQDPPLGEPMWDACGRFVLGRVEGDQAVFDRV